MAIPVSRPEYMGGLGLYGYTLMYREIKDKKYLDRAKSYCPFYSGSSSMPTDKVPYWDFNALSIPRALHYASAAVVMASALLEFREYA